MSCALVVARGFLRQASHNLPSLKVVKILESLLIYFLKESTGEQATLKFSTNLVFAGQVVVMSPVELINVIVSG